MSLTSFPRCYWLIRSYHIALSIHVFFIIIIKISPDKTSTLRSHLNVLHPLISNLSSIRSLKTTLLKTLEPTVLFHSDSAICSCVILLSYLCTHFLILSNAWLYGINSVSTSIQEPDSGTWVSLRLMFGLYCLFIWSLQCFI